MKVRTLDQLLEFSDRERVWRIREIVVLRGACVDRALSDRQREVQRRAFIPLAYAHWEGFAKSVGQAYLDYVASQRLTLAELAPCFQSIYFSIENGKDLRSGKRHNLLAVLDSLVNRSDHRVHLKTKNVVSTQDNLNSEALHDVCRNLGFDYDAFSDVVPFLDKVLLGKRNSIAHGESLFVSDDNIDEIAKRVVDCIDRFKTQVENSATTKAFRTAA